MMTTHKWWQNEVIYQIYPASFKDANNDGIGDLRGIREKLPVLKSLGVTMIWLSPIYQSPMVDNGYDISDYQAINPQFGTMADFDALMKTAKRLQIKVMMDLVINHTSDQHRWFQSALHNPQSPYRHYYIFRPGQAGGPPNNWRSNFGAGSAWTKVPRENQYYLHVFSPQQPDLNWENPQMRRDIYHMINWWLEKGVSGFRIDAITFIKKDQDFAALTPDGSDGLGQVKRKSENRPGLAKFLHELNQETFKKTDAVTVGEASGVSYDQLGQFIGKQGYFSMIFDFHYADIDVASGSEWYRRKSWTVAQLRDAIVRSQLAIQKVGWGANFLENHDQPRSLNKFIKVAAYRDQRGAKVLGLLYFYLRGCPFIYQGQELGMQNVCRDSIDEFNDPSSHANYTRAIEEGLSQTEALACVNARSRDNGRVPYPWDHRELNAGFNQGHKTWLALSQQKSGVDLTSETQDPDSVWHFYQHMIKLRQHSNLSESLIQGDFIPLATKSDTVIAYQRGDNVQVLVNLSSHEVPIIWPKGRIRLNTLAANRHNYLLPYQGILFEVEKDD